MFYTGVQRSRVLGPGHVDVPANPDTARGPWGDADTDTDTDVGCGDDDGETEWLPRRQVPMGERIHRYRRTSIHCISNLDISNSCEISLFSNSLSQSKMHSRIESWL